MTEFFVTHLRFTAMPLSSIGFGAQPGSQLRGALYNALRKHDCPLLPSQEPDAYHAAVCPVCRLLSPRDPDGSRGHTPPPPFAIQPPLKREYQAATPFSFGVSLFGDQADLYPYLLHGVRRMGETGVGRGRGRFVLHAVYAVHPLTGERESLLEEGQVQRPRLRVTGRDVRIAARHLPADHLTLRFRTPTRLIANGRPIDLPHFAVLLARLLERLDLLFDQYAPGMASPPHQDLGERAASVALSDCYTHWLDIRSGSQRHGRTTPIGGFVGQASYTGDLSPFLPWLVWGQSVQVGKNTAKGDGWYEIVR